MTDEKMIEQTNNWIKSVVVDLNFCPFAAKPLLQKSIHYAIHHEATIVSSLDILEQELNFLTEHKEVETTFIIFPDAFSDFQSYLTLVKKATKILSKLNYDGIYQIASFHPEYCFEDSDNDDAANYTNRSIYPMLHILREESITKALTLFKHPEEIPERNFNLAREKGLHYMKLLRASCL